MVKAEFSIYGKKIYNAIGFCHCKRHEGALNREIAYKHKCIAKKCKYLEKYNEESWDLKPKYKNKKGIYNGIKNK